jgi:nicotinate-nucleotide pyrophosphorylase (carboxylating)
MTVVEKMPVQATGYEGFNAVSPLFAEIHAEYGAAFDAALARNVADALAEDIGTGDQTGRLVPADDARSIRASRFNGVTARAIA